MTKTFKSLLCAVSATALLTLSACDKAPEVEATTDWASPESQARAGIYTDYTLSADLSHLSDNQRKMISLLIDASKIMDDLYWQQAYGDKAALLASLNDADAKSFAMKNYGPWDRLDGDKPFLKGVGEKPLGANLYPADMTKAEFEAYDNADKVSLYSLIRRDETGKLTSIPYHQAYATELSQAADLMREAATYADNETFKAYLIQRADALVSDDYQASDFSWMDRKSVV